jgi:uncharacterized protein
MLWRCQRRPMSEPRTRLFLRVAPGAKRSRIVGRFREGWKVQVAAPPVDGRANATLEAYLAGVLGVGRRHVRVVTGAAGRDKWVEVDGRDETAAERLLLAAAETTR